LGRSCGASATGPPSPPDPDAILALPEHGRGLTIARAALDSLEYDRTTSGENHWKLTKQA
jgi:anti-sigma regulatory factor (Ser/Thr protein kinase)